MAQFNKNDVASNSVLWAPSQFNKTANSANRDALFGNTTVSAFISNKIVGMFGVDTTEANVASGNLVSGIITYAGTGYTANAAVTLTVTNGGTSGTANATANSTGKISALNVAVAGSGYVTKPTVVIAAPANTTFNANTAVTAGPDNGTNGANSVITISSAGAFVIGDPLVYQVATNNTAISGLTSGTTYYVQFANSTVVALANSPTGSRITLTKGLTETGHALTGVQATGVITVGGAKNNGVTHAGWVVRTVGTGGRAGRVTYETLVAMGSLTGDASDDSILPDA
jgi:hypothetical protein